MKKAIICAAAVCIAFTACEELQKNDFGDINNSPILSDHPTTPLQPSEQKTKLASVASNLMDSCPAEDFEKIINIASEFSNTFDESDYDFKPLYEWASTQIGNAYKEETETIEQTGKVKIKNSTDLLILLANHKGHFRFGDSALTVDQSFEGIKASFSLNGKNYEAVIEQQGKVTEAIYNSTSEDSSMSYGYSDENGNWVSVDYGTWIERESKLKVKVGIPEKLLISITENGIPIAQITAEFTLSITSSGIEPTKDSFSTKITISLEDYEYVIHRLMYDGASGKASLSETLMKNGKSLLGFSVSGDLRISIETRTHDGSNYSYKYQYIKAELAKNISIAIDVLGEVQLIGTCSNALEASESISAFRQALYNDKDEDTAKRHLENFNSKFDSGVFYDRGNNKQASFEYTYLAERYMPGYDINYRLFPIIVFNDDSKYSMEEFFNEDSFGDLIEKFYDFCGDFEEVFGELFEKEEYYPGTSM